MNTKLAFSITLLLALLVGACAPPVAVTMAPPFYSVTPPPATSAPVAVATTAPVAATSAPAAATSAPAAATSTPPSVPAGKHYRIGLVIPGLQNEAMVGLKNGVEGEAAKVGNITVMTTADQVGANQVKAFEDYLASGVDGIIYDAMDTNAISPSVLKANAANVPVIAMYAGASKGKEVLVSSDPHQYGVWTGEYFCKNLPHGANISEVEGDPGDEFITKARDGFVATIQACGLNLVASAPSMFDRAKGLQIATDQLTAHPDLAGMYGAIDDLAMSIISALKTAGLSGKVKVAGLNLTCEGAGALLKGDMNFTVAQLPVAIGTTALDTMVEELNGQQVPSELIANGVPIDSAMAQGILNGTIPNPPGTDLLARLQAAQNGCKK